MDPASIETNLGEVKKRMAAACERAGRAPSDVTLIAVSKTVEPAAIETAYGLGVYHFGENRVQEAATKIYKLGHLSPHPIWHMIGHLQSNKVKAALEVFDIIQSVDSVALAEVLDLKARQRGNRTSVFLQVNVSGETSKSGFSLKDVENDFAKIRHLPQIDIRGLMTIAPPSDDPERSRSIFRKLRQLRDQFGLEHLSMGMTGDFEVAIEEGATMVRIGRAIFGERN